jgi:hypothetical protein
MADQNATQTGAEEFQPAYSARSAALQQIAKNVHSQNAADMAGFDEETGEVAQGQMLEEDNQQETEREQEAPQENQAQDEHETIVVDGKEVKVQRAQLIDAGRRTLQKESAADKRLQEATEALNRAKAYERSMSQRQPSTDAGESEQMPSSDASNGAGQAAPANQREVFESILWDREASKAAKMFEKEFSDIVSDPFAMKLVVQLENERLGNAASEGKALYKEDPWEAYKTHGEKVREWLGKIKPPQASEDKTERKRSATIVVGASAKMQQSQPKKPLTTSEIIEQQRLSRQGRQIPNAR